MSVTRITYFVHGTTFDNEAGISSGWKNVRLSPLGLEQNKALGKQLEKRRFDAVFSSDLHRAVATAETLFERKMKIRFDERLRECNYGRYNGFPSPVVEPLQQRHIHDPFPEGESYEQVRQRVRSLLDDIRADYAGADLAFVSHKAPQLALEVLLSGKSWEQAFAEDWRRAGRWQPGWEYRMGDEVLLTE